MLHLISELEELKREATVQEGIEGETVQASGSENFRLRGVELYGRVVE